MARKRTLGKLEKVKIGGFRSIRDLDLCLGDLTVLIGSNGSGKSNLLSFFDMLSYAFFGALQLYVGRAGGGSSLLHYGPKHTKSLEAHLEFDSGSSVKCYDAKLALAARDAVVFIDESLTRRVTARSSWTDILGTGQSESALRAAAKDDLHPDRQKAAALLTEWLRDVSTYHFHDTSMESPLRTSQDVERNRSLLTQGANLASFLFRLREANPADFARVMSAVRVVAPFIRELLLEPDPLNGGNRILLRWQDADPEYEFGVHQLSDGSLRAIALVALLLQPPDELPGILLIDEPELGLHPSAVSLIGDLIRSASSKRQVIVATQSPRFVSSFAPEDVVVVDRHEYEPGRSQSFFRRLSRDELGAWLDDYDLGSLYEMNVTGGGPA